MKKLIQSIISLIILAAIAIAANEAFIRKPIAEAEVFRVKVAEGQSLGEVANTLKEASVISSTSLFDFIGTLSGAAKDLHAGTYIFKKGMSVVDALKTLNFVGRQEISVTIPEGWNLRQIAEKLVASGLIKSPAELYAVTGEPANPNTTVLPALVRDFPILKSKPAGVSLEGYLFPDTYRFYSDATAEDVVRKMLDTLKSKTSGMIGNLSFHDELTLASIVEDEVRDEADRAKVADIMLRRMQEGIALQVDSSVNYVTGKNTPSISSDDRAIDSLWNTYAHRGLPPGPISNPGLASLRAALAPTPNAYWYFLTTPDGAVIYSKTLDEHNAAKAKYLK